MRKASRPTGAAAGDAVPDSFSPGGFLRVGLQDPSLPSVRPAPDASTAALLDAETASAPLQHLMQDLDQALLPCSSLAEDFNRGMSAEVGAADVAISPGATQFKGAVGALVTALVPPCQEPKPEGSRPAAQLLHQISNISHGSSKVSTLESGANAASLNPQSLDLSSNAAAAVAAPQLVVQLQDNAMQIPPEETKGHFLEHTVALYVGPQTSPSNHAAPCNQSLSIPDTPLSQCEADEPLTISASRAAGAASRSAAEAEEEAKASVEQAKVAEAVAVEAWNQAEAVREAKAVAAAVKKHSEAVNSSSPSCKQQSHADLPPSNSLVQQPSKPFPQGPDSSSKRPLHMLSALGNDSPAANAAHLLSADVLPNTKEAAAVPSLPLPPAEGPLSGTISKQLLLGSQHTLPLTLHHISSSSRSSEVLPVVPADHQAAQSGMATRKRAADIAPSLGSPQVPSEKSAGMCPKALPSEPPPRIALQAAACTSSAFAAGAAPEVACVTEDIKQCVGDLPATAVCAPCSRGALQDQLPLEYMEDSTPVTQNPTPEEVPDCRVVADLREPMQQLQLSNGAADSKTHQQPQVQQQQVEDASVQQVSKPLQSSAAHQLQFQVTKQVGQNSERLELQTAACPSPAAAALISETSSQEAALLLLDAPHCAASVAASSQGKAAAAAEGPNPGEQLSPQDILLGEEAGEGQGQAERTAGAGPFSAQSGVQPKQGMEQQDQLQPDYGNEPQQQERGLHNGQGERREQQGWEDAHRDCQVKQQLQNQQQETLMAVLTQDRLKEFAEGAGVWQERDLGCGEQGSRPSAQAPLAPAAAAAATTTSASPYAAATADRVEIADATIHQRRVNIQAPAAAPSAAAITDAKVCALPGGIPCKEGEELGKELEGLLAPVQSEGPPYTSPGTSQSLPVQLCKRGERQQRGGEEETAPQLQLTASAAAAGGQAWGLQPPVVVEAVANALQNTISGYPTPNHAAAAGEQAVGCQPSVMVEALATALQDTAFRNPTPDHSAAVSGEPGAVKGVAALEELVEVGGSCSASDHQCKSQQVQEVRQETALQPGSHFHSAPIAHHSSVSSSSCCPGLASAGPCRPQTGHKRKRQAITTAAGVAKETQLVLKDVLEGKDAVAGEENAMKAAYRELHKAANSADEVGRTAAVAAAVPLTTTGMADMPVACWADSGATAGQEEEGSKIPSQPAGAIAAVASAPVAASHAEAVGEGAAAPNSKLSGWNNHIPLERKQLELDRAEFPGAAAAGLAIKRPTDAEHAEAVAAAAAATPGKDHATDPPAEAVPVSPEVPKDFPSSSLVSSKATASAGEPADQCRDALEGLLLEVVGRWQVAGAAEKRQKRLLNTFSYPQQQKPQGEAAAAKVAEPAAAAWSPAMLAIFGVYGVKIS
jgi:hypothetical protein